MKTWISVMVLDLAASSMRLVRQQMGDGYCKLPTIVYWQAMTSLLVSTGTWSSSKTVREVKEVIYLLLPRILKRSVPIFLNRGSFSPTKTFELDWSLSATIHHKIIPTSQRTLASRLISAKFKGSCQAFTRQEEVMALKRSPQHWHKL